MCHSRPSPDFCRASRGVRHLHRENTGDICRGAAAPARSTATASRTAFNALLLRDLTVLRKNLGIFIARTLSSLFSWSFVFLYVVSSNRAGCRRSFRSWRRILLCHCTGCRRRGPLNYVPGNSAVALPLANEFGYTKEIEDRVLAPLPVSLVAIGKVVAGAIQGLSPRQSCSPSLQ
jgi:ABC-2 type transport system permease protein